MKGTSTPIVAAALAVALTSTASAALATPASTSTQPRWAVTAEEQVELAAGLLGPLRVGIGRGNTAYVSQNFGGLLTSVDRNGATATALERPGIEVGGVSTNKGEVYFTESAGGPGGEGELVANVSVVEGGSVRVLADLAALETVNNYDALNSYGFQNLSPECTKDIPEAIAPLALPRGGDTYSHPYATAVSNSGRYVYVADAGANAVFTVDTRRNTVSATVLEPVAVEMTQELYESLVAQQIPLPACVVGATFNSEPVPTDIEFGPDGMLYLTSLPGAPEAPGSGSIQRLDPATGTVEGVVTGLTSPTGLALDRQGNMFVAELFAGRISIIPAGTTEAVPFLEAASPADVEIDGKYLYATTGALAPSGTLVRSRLDYTRQ